MAACTVGRVDLVDLVDFSGVECLNAAEGSWANVLKAGYREDEGAPPPVRLSARLPARPAPLLPPRPVRCHRLFSPGLPLSGPPPPPPPPPPPAPRQACTSSPTATSRSFSLFRSTRW